MTPVSSTTSFERIAATLALKCAAIDPSLTRFSMSGLTSKLTDSPARRTYHGDVAAGAVNFQSRFHRRVLAADDHHSLAIVRVRLLVEVRHVRQIFAGHVQEVRQAVIPHRQHDVPGFARARDAARRARLDHERPGGSAGG